MTTRPPSSASPNQERGGERAGERPATFASCDLADVTLFLRLEDHGPTSVKSVT